MPAVHAAAVITMKPLNKLFVGWLYELVASLRENWKSTAKKCKKYFKHLETRKWTSYDGLAWDRVGNCKISTLIPIHSHAFKCFWVSVGYKAKFCHSVFILGHFSPVLTRLPNLVSFGALSPGQILMETGSGTITRKKHYNFPFSIEVFALAMTCAVPELVYRWDSVPNK